MGGSRVALAAACGVVLAAGWLASCGLDRHGALPSGSPGEGGAAGATQTSSAGGSGGEAGSGGAPSCSDALPCPEPACDGASLTEWTCEGGRCQAQALDCLPYLCADGACLDACAATTDCASPDDFCDLDTGTCVPRAVQGELCDEPDGCAALLSCAPDGICCDQPCDGDCLSCGTGTCGPVALWTDPDGDCSHLLGCDGAGTCATCGYAVPPPGLSGTCPSVCNGGCTPGGNPTHCKIDCIGTNACKNVTRTCPDGFDCQLVCSGTGACEGVDLYCPPDHLCTASCSDNGDSCKNADFWCSKTGPCDIACNNGDSRCTGAEIHCGNNECEVDCAGGTDPSIHCSSAMTESCDCDTEGC